MLLLKAKSQSATAKRIAPLRSNDGAMCIERCRRQSSGTAYDTKRSNQNAGIIKLRLNPFGARRDQWDSLNIQGPPMIVVIDKKRTPDQPRGRGRHGAMILAIAALAVATAAWFWLMRQPPSPEAGTVLPHGVIVVGLGVFISSLIAQVRSMSVLEMLEALWDATVWLAALVIAIVAGALRAIWDWFLGLIGLR
jgi:hypothetical protein